MNEKNENVVEVKEVSESTPVESTEEPKKKKFNIKNIAKTIAVFGTGIVAGLLLGKKEDDSYGYSITPNYFEPTVNDVDNTPTDVTED